MKNKTKDIATIATVCLPALVYIIWIDVYYWLLEGARYKAFMQPKLWPLSVLALILLVIFVAAFIAEFSWKQINLSKTDTWVRASVLMVPVLFLWTVYGQSLGAYAFSKRSLSFAEMTAVPGPGSGKASSANLSEDKTTLLDLLRNADAFNGKHVAVEGMVYREADIPDNAFMLIRFAVICCAADALPLGVVVRSDSATTLKNDTWVRVEGQVNMDTINGRQRPGIVAERVQIIPLPPPEMRYLFF